MALCCLGEPGGVKSEESEVAGFNSLVRHGCNRLAQCALSFSPSVVLSLKWANNNDNNNNSTYPSVMISRSSIDNVKPSI